MALTLNRGLRPLESSKLRLKKDDLGCQCAMSDTCKAFDKPTLCSCDARGFNLTDEGILSSDQLPVYGVQLGGSYTPYSNVKFNIGPLICSGKEGHYPSEAKILEKEKMNLRLNELTNDIKDTKADLIELSDQAEEFKKQNLNSRLNLLKNEMNETKEDLDELAHRADEVEQQNFNSKIHNLTNEIAETKEGLQDLSEQLEDHLRTTTTTTSTTTTTTTTYPRLYLQKIEPYRLSKMNMIGEITEYFHNYEFSMELKYKSLESQLQLIHDMVLIQSFRKSLNVGQISHIKINRLNHLKLDKVLLVTTRIHYFSFGHLYVRTDSSFIFTRMDNPMPETL